MTCPQELCRNWTGQGCICEVMDLEPDVATEDDEVEPWLG